MSTTVPPITESAAKSRTGRLKALSPARMLHWYAEISARKAGFRTEALQLPDGQLQYRVGGQGPLLLLVHGFGGDGLVTWGGPMRFLAARHTVVVPDLLWFGQSWSEGPASLGAQADAIGRLLDVLPGPVAVAGLSYGGFVALELAHRHPDRLRHVVILSSPGTVYQPEDLEGLLARAGTGSAEDLFIPRSADDMVRLMRVAAPMFKYTPAWLLEDMRHYYYNAREHKLRELMGELVGAQLEHRLRLDKATLPSTTLVWGTEDRIFPLEIGERLAHRLGVPLIRVDGAGHNLPFDAPGKTAFAIEQALREANQVPGPSK